MTAAVIAVLGLSACGRYGPLELPPGPTAVQPVPAAANPSPSASLLPTASPVSDMYAAPGTQQDPVAKTGFDAQGNPVVGQRGPRRPFILDPLLQ